MPDKNQLRPQMRVSSSDNQDLGHITHIYEDSFLVEKGLLFHKDRYVPYSAIAQVDNDQVQLTVTADEINKETTWDKRPAYADHLGDPTQLMYDRGHGLHDPFDETKT